MQDEKIPQSFGIKHSPDVGALKGDDWVSARTEVTYTLPSITVNNGNSNSQVTREVTGGNVTSNTRTHSDGQRIRTETFSYTQGPTVRTSTTTRTVGPTTYTTQQVAA